MKKFVLLLFAVLTVIGFTPFIATQPASASTFNANNIIDDYTFENTSTMSATTIDSWLNSNFPSSCISSNANSNGNPGFRTPKPLGWSDSQNQYLYGSNTTAGQAIASVSALYNINPQVILTTLQKEQSLVRGGAGCYYNSPNPAAAVNSPCGTASTPCTVACIYAGGCMNIALGYGCPNYCAAKDEGFHKQITLGTWVLRFNQQRAYGRLTGYTGYETGDKNFTYVGPMTAGYRQRVAGGASVYYDGHYTTQDGTSVTISNGATASLYTFTPFISGNKSFSNIFQGSIASGYLGFGNTTGPFYQFSSIVRPPATLAYGKTSSVQIKLTNTSSQTWYSDGHVPTGSHPFRLMTPWYANSPWADTSDPAWLGTKNQIRMVESSVAPGATATFQFNIKAPNYTANNAKLSFILVQDGVKVYQDLGIYFYVSSHPDYSYSVVSADMPKGLLPGDMYIATFKLKNTGEETWYSDSNLNVSHPNAIRLATSGYKNFPYSFPYVDPAWLGTQNQITMVESSVAPGATATFKAIITSPYSSISNYRPDFRLVLDGKKFIAGPTISSTISTPPLIADYSFVSAINPPTTMTPGQQATVYIKIRNTGNAVWRNFSNKLLSANGLSVLIGDTRMITHAPVYGNSPFAANNDPTWLGTKNQIRMVEPVVGPGKVGTFSVNITAPTTPGKYQQYFRFAIDGRVVMKDLGLQYRVTVVP